MGSRIGVETNLPPGWPGLIHREGRTLTRVTELPDSNKKGPSSKSVGFVFHNPAMAGSRTRSVLLMAFAIESGILGDSKVRALDGLSASGSVSYTHLTLPTILLV